MIDKPYLSATEARAILGVNKNRIARLIKTGVLPAIRDPLDGRSKWIARADIDALMVTRKKIRGGTQP